MYSWRKISKTGQSSQEIKGLNLLSQFIIQMKMVGLNILILFPELLMEFEEEKMVQVGSAYKND